MEIIGSQAKPSNPSVTHVFPTDLSGSWILLCACFTNSSKALEGSRQRSVLAMLWPCTVWLNRLNGWGKLWTCDDAYSLGFESLGLILILEMGNWLIHVFARFLVLAVRILQWFYGNCPCFLLHLLSHVNCNNVSLKFFTPLGNAGQ